MAWPNISLVAVGQKITAAIANSIIGPVNAQGLTLIVPTSVTGAGSSVSAGGTVTLSGNTAGVILNGVFTSKFQSYRIVMNLTTSSGTSTYINLSSGGTVNSTANYDNQRLTGGGATANSAQNLATTGWNIKAVNTTTDDSWSIDIYGPAVASPCTALVQHVGTANPMTATAAEAGLYAVAMRLSTAFDGFQVSALGTSLSGTISVYGYNAS